MLQQKVRRQRGRTKDPETKRNTRGLILHTGRSEPPKAPASPEPPSAPKVPGQIDAGIRKAVELFQKHGVETFESCEGGPGHSYPEPTVAFYGTHAAGWRAVAVCLDYGLPVLSLRRVWDVLDTSDVTGPHWEITFRRRML